MVELTVKETYRLMFKNYPDVMDVKQVCEAMNVCDRTVYKLINSGNLPAVRIGRKHRIAKLHVISYLEINMISD